MLVCSLLLPVRWVLCACMWLHDRTKTCLCLWTCLYGRVRVEYVSLSAYWLKVFCLAQLAQFIHASIHPSHPSFIHPSSIPFILHPSHPSHPFIYRIGSRYNDSRHISILMMMPVRITQNDDDCMLRRLR